MNHPTLPFEARKLARRKDPDTSKAAAASCRELRGRHHAAIIAALKDAGRPLVADEIGERVDLTGVQVGKRIHELMKAGLIEHDGEGISYSGRRARAFRVRGVDGL